ncbi:MAG: hypothetical protein U0K36_01660 [Bacteroidales bacterium]|nr:hypothetical protein [Bacteroidales bacterium]
MKYTALTIIAALAAASLNSCKRTQTTTNFEDATEQAGNAAPDSVMEDDLNKSKTIMYTLPAPVEMASIIKETGVRFDDQLLANISQANHYTTNLKLALNLGIYATDMSLSGMFNQSQRMVDYLNTLREMTQRLGIINIMDDEVIAKLENSELTRQGALNVISEVYMKTNQNLTENNRRNVATIVMAGGWVEGLYLALNIINADRLNADIVSRIVSQKLTIATMLNIIETQNPDGTDEDLQYVKGKIDEISDAFAIVNVEKEGRVSAITDPETRTTTIKANMVGTLDKETLKILRDKVTEIRSEFVQ